MIRSITNACPLRVSLPEIPEVSMRMKKLAALMAIVSSVALAIFLMFFPPLGVVLSPYPLFLGLAAKSKWDELREVDFYDRRLPNAYIQTDRSQDPVFTCPRLAKEVFQTSDLRKYIYSFLRLEDNPFLVVNKAFRQEAIIAEIHTKNALRFDQVESELILKTKMLTLGQYKTEKKAVKHYTRVNEVTACLNHSWERVKLEKFLDFASQRAREKITTLQDGQSRVRTSRESEDRQNLKRILSQLPNLTQLRQTQGTFDASLLQDTPHLTQACLVVPSASDFSVLIHLPKLEKLILYFPDQQGGAPPFSLPHSHPSITHLELTCITNRDLNFLQQLPNLTYLKIDVAEQLTNTWGLGSSTLLKELTLIDCPQVRDLSSVDLLRDLTTINLMRCDGVNRNYSYSSLMDWTFLTTSELEQALRSEDYDKAFRTSSKSPPLTSKEKLEGSSYRRATEIENERSRRAPRSWSTPRWGRIDAVFYPWGFSHLEDEHWFLRSGFRHSQFSHSYGLTVSSSSSRYNLGEDYQRSRSQRLETISNNLNRRRSFDQLVCYRLHPSNLLSFNPPYLLANGKLQGFDPSRYGFLISRHQSNSVAIFEYDPTCFVPQSSALSLSRLPKIVYSDQSALKGRLSRLPSKLTVFRSPIEMMGLLARKLFRTQRENVDQSTSTSASSHSSMPRKRIRVYLISEDQCFYLFQRYLNKPSPGPVIEEQPD